MNKVYLFDGPWAGRHLCFSYGMSRTLEFILGPYSRWYKVTGEWHDNSSKAT